MKHLSLILALICTCWTAQAQTPYVSINSIMTIPQSDLQNCNDTTSYWAIQWSHEASSSATAVCLKWLLAAYKAVFVRSYMWWTPPQVAPWILSAPSR